MFELFQEDCERDLIDLPEEVRIIGRFAVDIKELTALQNPSSSENTTSTWF